MLKMNLELKKSGLWPMSKKLSPERLQEIREWTGSSNQYYQQELLDHIAAQDAEIETWKQRSVINGKEAFKLQDERDSLRAQIDKAKGALKKMENEFVQKHDGPVVTRHYYARDVLAELEKK